MHPKQDFVQRELLLLSQSEEWATAQTEWQLINCYWADTYGECLCLTRIKERCIIENKVTSKRALVGNCCVKQFMSHLSETTDAMFASLKKVHLNDSKSLHPDLVNMAVSRGVIAPWAARISQGFAPRTCLVVQATCFPQAPEH